MDEKLVAENPENLFNCEEKDISDQAKLICEIKNRPIIEYILSVLFLVILLILLPDYYLWIILLLIFINIIFFSINNKTIMRIYDDFLVLYWNKENKNKMLIINNKDIITWEIKNKQFLEIYFYNSEKEIKAVVLPVNNLQQLENKLNKYYREKNSVKQRVNTFVERVKTNDGKTMYQKLIDKIKRKTR